MHNFKMKLARKHTVTLTRYKYNSKVPRKEPLTRRSQTGGQNKVTKKIKCSKLRWFKRTEEVHSAYTY